jgi:hypothetical protein
MFTNNSSECSTFIFCLSGMYLNLGELAASSLKVQAPFSEKHELSVMPLKVQKDSHGQVGQTIAFSVLPVGTIKLSIQIQYSAYLLELAVILPIFQLDRSTAMILPKPGLLELIFL